MRKQACLQTQVARRCIRAPGVQPIPASLVRHGKGMLTSSGNLFSLLSCAKPCVAVEKSLSPQAHLLQIQASHLWRLALL